MCCILAVFLGSHAWLNDLQEVEVITHNTPAFHASDHLMCLIWKECILGVTEGTPPQATEWPPIGPLAQRSPSHWFPNPLVPHSIVWTHWTAPTSPVPHLIGPLFISALSICPSQSMVPHLVGSPTHPWEWGTNESEDQWDGGPIEWVRWETNDSWGTREMRNQWKGPSGRFPRT